MNVKYTSPATAFSHDPNFYVTPPKRGYEGLTQEQKRRKNRRYNSKKGCKERVVKFERAQPTCDCKGGYRFQVVPLKQNSQDLCALCSHYVRWTKEIFVC